MENKLSSKKIIMLSIDAKLFEEGSAVSKRVIEYGKIFGELHVVVHTTPGFKEKKLAPNVFVYPTNSTSKKKYFRQAFNMCARFITPDSIVSSQDAFTHVVAIQLKKRFGVKIQLQYHTDFMNPHFKKESLKNYIKYHLYKWSLRYADSVRVVSERVKKSIVSCTKAPIVVLPLYVDVSVYNSPNKTSLLKKKFPQFEFLFLTVSRLEKEKNIEIILEAFKKIFKNNPRAGLVVVGDGTKKKLLQNKTVEFEIQNNVVFEGWQNNLTQYYEEADAFLLASNYEGYNLTLIEAAISGVPIITTDVGVVGEIFSKDKDVLVCKMEDVDSFASQMSKILGDVELRNKLKQNGQRAVQPLTESFESYIKKYGDSFNSLLQS